MPQPNLFTLPPSLPFVDALAAGVLDQVGTDPLALSQATILLPTARAKRSLREAFLRRSEGQVTLLPRISSLNDVDEDELSLRLEGLAGSAGGLDLAPAISPLRRQLLLTRLVIQAQNFTATIPQAARLAKELGKLIDQVQTEGLDFARLTDLVPEDYAEHWQKTLRFLTIVTEHWPAMLAEVGCVDPAADRNARLAALAQAFQADPPAGPVIAAGSTGSIPATADLLAVIARLPRGAVVLPGLDQDMDALSWEALDPAHPQFGLKSLLDRLGVRREEVRPWPVPADVVPRSPASRGWLLAEALRPADTTEAWRDLDSLPDDALDGLMRVDAPTPQEEAGTIALILRQVLETPRQTAALVTPDRDLARRVAMELRRWGVEVDDSAGRPLSATPVGSFLRLLADTAVDPSPVRWLSLLKHPLAAGGLETTRFRRHARALERAIFRGPRPPAGLEGLRHAVTTAEDRAFATHGEREELLSFLDGLAGRLGPLLEAMRGEDRPLADWVELHGTAAEALAGTDKEHGALRLWAGDDGEAAARFLREAKDAAEGFPALSGTNYAGMLEVLLGGQVVRPSFGLHPRLHILGLLEARLQQFDVMVLGGLNEGTWPPAPPADPWMSRPMRQAFGLPAPERQVGQTAHDFAQAAGAPLVVLTRSERVEGTPTVPSRWLLRLDTVLDKAHCLPALTAEAGEWLALQRALDWPEAVRPCPAPAPTPPVSARPRRLSVTQVEAWMRDPYAVYARHVLGLSALDPIDADPGAAERGQVLHAALDAFVRKFPEKMPPNARQELLACGRDAFGPLLDQPGVYAFWWPRFERVADWFLALEEQRRAAKVMPLATEVKGQLVIDGPAGPFTLTAKADRLDRLPDGRLSILDYKTGTPPSAKEVRLGKAPQLPLEALIAEAGGFEKVPAAKVGGLEFWQLSGGDPAGKVHDLSKEDPSALAAEARDGLAALVALFDDPATPYRSQPRPGWAPRYTDYAHLARVAEWSAGGGEGEG